jgi:serine/threonine-protein kinase HipA
MNRCPITYETIGEGTDYSARGLKLLDRNLRSLAPLGYTAAEQRQEALNRAGKMSIQGIQPKLSAVLRAKDGCFDIVDRHGKFILKPPSLDFPELPENESLTMRLAGALGIEVPLHGLVYASDRSLTYFIKRFDRRGRERIPVEDFAQLSAASRETKYESSMEKVASVVDRFCTFPAIERVKLFERTLFSFLVGNEDMHLKNFSLISRNGRTDLSPAYDLLNTTIALAKPAEEMALPIRGKKSNLTRNDIVNYFAGERLQLNDRVLGEMLERFSAAFPLWEELIASSFLSPEKKVSYAGVVNERKARLGLG